MVIIMDMESGRCLQAFSLMSADEPMTQEPLAERHAPAAWTEAHSQIAPRQPVCHPQLQLGLQTYA